MRNTIMIIIQMNYTPLAIRLELVLIDKKKTSNQVDLVIPVDYRLKIKGMPVSCLRA